MDEPITGNEQLRRWHELAPSVPMIAAGVSYALGYEAVGVILLVFGGGMVVGQCLMRLAGYGR
jgi:hypothetical protein